MIGTFYPFTLRAKTSIKEKQTRCLLTSYHAIGHWVLLFIMYMSYHEIITASNLQTIFQFVHPFYSWSEIYVESPWKRIKPYSMVFSLYSFLLFLGKPLRVLSYPLYVFHLWFLKLIIDRVVVFLSNILLIVKYECGGLVVKRP